MTGLEGAESASESVGSNSREEKNDVEGSIPQQAVRCTERHGIT